MYSEKGSIPRRGAKTEDGHHAPVMCEEPRRQDLGFPSSRVNGTHLKVFIEDSSTCKKGNYERFPSFLET